MSKRWHASGRVALVLLALALTRPGWADALTGYSVQVLAQVGQASGDFTPRVNLFVSQLNDRGQMILFTVDSKGNPILGQWSEGKFIPIAAAGVPLRGARRGPQG